MWHLTIWNSARARSQYSALGQKAAVDRLGTHVRPVGGLSRSDMGTWPKRPREAPGRCYDHLAVVRL
jgi:hypothetical protein